MVSASRCRGGAERGGVAGCCSFGRLGRPVLGEGGELQLVCCGAGALVGEKADRVRDLMRVGERLGGHPRAGGSGERLDA